MVLLGSRLVEAPIPVPYGSSILSAVRASPEPAAKSAVTLVEWAVVIEVEEAAISTVGGAGGVTASEAGVGVSK